MIKKEVEIIKVWKWNTVKKVSEEIVEKRKDGFQGQWLWRLKG